MDHCRNGIGSFNDIAWARALLWRFCPRGECLERLFAMFFCGPPPEGGVGGCRVFHPPLWWGGLFGRAGLGGF